MIKKLMIKKTKIKTIINNKPPKNKMTKSIIVHVQVKDAATKAGIPNVSEDFYAELEGKVKKIVEEACNRAKRNNRTTVMGKDV